MIKPWHCFLVVAGAFAVHVLAQPPLPPIPLSAQMRQSPVWLVTVRVTNTVETVYDAVYIKAIYTATNATGQQVLMTNFLRMEGSNIVSCVTNTTPAFPQ